MKFAEGERARRGPEVCAFRGRFVETFDIIAQKGGDVNGGLVGGGPHPRFVRCFYR